MGLPVGTSQSRSATYICTDTAGNTYRYGTHGHPSGPAPPRHAKIERAGVAQPRDFQEVFLCSLIEERTISNSLRPKNC